MKYCSKCGQEIVDDAVVCTKCGCAVDAQRGNTNVVDAPNGGFAVLSFFFPIIGLILFCVWKSTFPRKAKSAGTGAFIGFIGFILNIVFYIGACLFFEYI